MYGKQRFYDEVMLGQSPLINANARLIENVACNRSFSFCNLIITLV